MGLIREGFQKEVNYTSIFKKAMTMDQQRRWEAFQELEEGLELAHRKSVPIYLGENGRWHELSTSTYRCLTHSLALIPLLILGI